MTVWIDEHTLRKLRWASAPDLRSPLPTRVISNGQCVPPPQTPEQRLVEAELAEIARLAAARFGLEPRAFLASAGGIVAGLAAMNEVYGTHFHVASGELAEAEAAEAARRALDHQLVIDAQLQFAHDEYGFEGLLGLRPMAKSANRDLANEPVGLDRLKFDNFAKEVFLDSQTEIGVLGGAPAANPSDCFSANRQLAHARAIVNAAAGARRLLCHALFTPGLTGWMEELERAIEEQKPESWTGYTVGDPFRPLQSPWRLDDEKLVYPAYERMVNAGIKTLFIHKGLLPETDSGDTAERRRYAMVDDVGPAARDWPDLRFVICHAGMMSFGARPQGYLEAFEQTGRIDWATDLAEIPARYGVDNVYAELGGCFASSAIVHPRLCAALLGTLIKGMGSERVLWGTDSIFYGSPQWQIEAFRRIEIPEDMQRRSGFTPLGAADGPVRAAILGLNAARLYDMQLDASGKPADIIDDEFARMRRFYREAGPTASNLAYGLVAV